MSKKNSMGSFTFVTWAAAELSFLLVVPTLFGQTKVAPSAPIRAAILIYDGVYDTELVAPLDVFNHAGRHTREQIRLFTVPQAGVQRNLPWRRIR